MTLIGNDSVDQSKEKMAQELRDLCEGFESGALVPMKESAMTFINLQEDGKKRYVIRFD